MREELAARGPVLRSQEAMILVLTYHKVLRGPDPESGFYTLAAEQLERQLELLAQSGLHALTPETLISSEPPPQRAYLLSFDDGTEDHYEVVLPLLARYGCRAVFFVPTAKLNRSGFFPPSAASDNLCFSLLHIIIRITKILF